MTPFGGAMGGGYRAPQMGFRPPQGTHLNALMQRRPVQGGFGAPNMATPNMGGSVGGQMVTPGGSPMPRPGLPNMPSPNPPPNLGGPNTFTGQMPGDGGPLGNLFMSLPQGTEEAFGAAPAGFNKTLRGGYKGPGIF